MNNQRGVEFLAGFLLGGIVGAAVALLMAPASGAETREQLRERGIELRNRGEEFSADAMKNAQMMAEEGQKRAAEMQERSRLALEEQKSRLQDAIDAGKQAAAQRRNDMMGKFEGEKAAKPSTPPATA